MRKGLFAIVALAGLTGGCAEMSTIYHTRPIAAPQTITVDAYQRNIAFVPDAASGGTGMRMCAEAAPDTFAAISASLGAEADVKTQSGKLAAALSQSGASIERTQTINLLRESMYRTCERYLSGAISKETLIVQAARDQRAMVAVLAIEQLTRTARPPAIILSAGTTSASVMNGDQVAKMIGGFSDERTAAKGALDKAQTAYNGSKATGKCDTVTTAPADDTGDPKLTDWTKCSQDKAKLDEAQKGFDAADKKLAQVLELATKVNPEGTAADTGAGPNNGGGGGGAPSEAALIAVARAVENIANAPGIDESLMFCIGYLSRLPAELDGNVSGRCMTLVENRAKADEDSARAYFGLAAETREGDRLGRASMTFDALLRTKIAAATDATIQGKIKAFEAAAGINGINTGMPAACTTKAKCTDELDDGGYAGVYRNHSVAMDAALKSW